MINNKMFCIILMVGTVDTPPSLPMSQGEKRKDFSHDRVAQWAGCVTGDVCCPICLVLYSSRAQMFWPGRWESSDLPVEAGCVLWLPSTWCEQT